MRSLIADARWAESREMLFEQWQCDIRNVRSLLELKLDSDVTAAACAPVVVLVACSVMLVVIVFGRQAVETAADQRRRVEVVGRDGVCVVCVSSFGGLHLLLT